MENLRASPDLSLPGPCSASRTEKQAKGPSLTWKAQEGKLTGDAPPTRHRNPPREFHDSISREVWTRLGQWYSSGVLQAEGKSFAEEPLLQFGQLGDSEGQGCKERERSAIYVW